MNDDRYADILIVVAISAVLFFAIALCATVRVYSNENGELKRQIIELKGEIKGLRK